MLKNANCAIFYIRYYGRYGANGIFKHSIAEVLESNFQNSTVLE